MEGGDDSEVLSTLYRRMMDSSIDVHFTAPPMSLVPLTGSLTDRCSVQYFQQLIVWTAVGVSWANLFCVFWFIPYFNSQQMGVKKSTVSVEIGMQVINPS